MWTDTRSQHARKGPGLPRDLTDAEWALTTADFLHVLEDARLIVTARLSPPAWGRVGVVSHVVIDVVIDVVCDGGWVGGG
jgi:hypothetical protein